MSCSSTDTKSYKEDLCSVPAVCSSCSTGSKTPVEDEALTSSISRILSDYPPVSDWQKGLSLLCESEEPPVILVDMDNTLVNWESQFERLMEQHYPEIPIVSPVERTHFKIELNYEQKYREPILHLTSLDEFWFSMDPIEGAVEAMKEMVSAGMLVFIVTTPDAEHTSRSAFEKIAWVERHLGPEWKYKSVLAHDKTLVRGDILIDDRPAASVGLLKPSWTHTLFSQPYNNRSRQCPRLDHWKDWGLVLYSVLLNREFYKRGFQTLGLVNDPYYKIHDACFSIKSNKHHSNETTDELEGIFDCCGNSKFGSPIGTTNQFRKTLPLPIDTIVVPHS